MIYFLSPDLPFPTGGVKQIHLQASYLQDAGHQVTILYTGSARPTIWFPARVPLRLAPPWLEERRPWRQRVVGSVRRLTRGPRSSPQARRLPALEKPVTDTDLLVIPEIYGAQLSRLPARVPKLILNQNSFLSFYGLDTASAADNRSLLSSYSTTGVIGQLANSPYGESYLRWAFPGLPTRTLELAVDSPPSVPELRQRDPLLVFFPRKSADILQQVFGILRNRGALLGWALQPLEGLTEVEVLRRFREARLYIASSLQEGLGLPPLEAMANGCAVVGFPAWGGESFLTDDFSRPVCTGDVLALARAVEECLEQLLSDPHAWQNKVDRARAMVKECHSPDRAAASTLAAFSAFLE